MQIHPQRMGESKMYGIGYPSRVLSAVLTSIFDDDSDTGDQSCGQNTMHGLFRGMGILS